MLARRRHALLNFRDVRRWSCSPGACGGLLGNGLHIADGGRCGDAIVWCLVHAFDFIGVASRLADHVPSARANREFGPRRRTNQRRCESVLDALHSCPN